MRSFTLINEIKKNAIIYFLIVFVLVIAIVSGYVVANNLNSQADNSISDYLYSAFKALKTSDVEINSNTILYNIILQNIFVFGIMILLGLIRFGFVFVYPIILFKGIISGFTCNIIIKAFSFLNATKIMLVLLPSSLLVLLLIIRCACKSIGYSLSKTISKTNSVINYDNELLSMRFYYRDQFKCVFPLVISCLWDAYVVVWILA